MGRSNLSFTFLSFQLLLFSLIIFNTNAQMSSNSSLQDVVCELVNCGEGKCVASNSSLFDCVCNPGWKKMQLGPLTFPACIVPNCTIDFQCGSGAPPSPPPPLPPPPPPPSSPAPFTPLSPCALVWCGDGNCIVNGTGYYCQCFEGSENLLDNTSLACFKQCYFGGDCKGLGFGPTTSPTATPPSTSGSSGNGPNDVPNCTRNLHALSLLVLSAIFLLWI